MHRVSKALWICGQMSIVFSIGIVPIYAYDNNLGLNGRFKWKRFVSHKLFQFRNAWFYTAFGQYIRVYCVSTVCVFSFPISKYFACSMFIHSELNIPCESNIVRNIQMGKCYANKILTAYNVWFSADLSYSMPYAIFHWFWMMRHIQQVGDEWKKKNNSYRYFVLDLHIHSFWDHRIYFTYTIDKIHWININWKMWP